MKKYNLENFYVGELYLSNFKANMSIDKDKERIKQNGAIGIENGIEGKHTRFVTLFYKQGNKYICLHDNTIYEQNGVDYIANIIPLKELLPKVNTSELNNLTCAQALELFDVLFKRKKTGDRLYNKKEEYTKDFYIADIVLPEEYKKVDTTNSQKQYIDLPSHIILENQNLLLYCFEENDYINAVYRCIFLKQGIDLYNINNNHFYNHHEDSFDSIIPFQEYINTRGITYRKDKITIPKALKLFKKTI